MSANRLLVPMGLAAIGEPKLEQVKQHARAFDADVLVLHVLAAGQISDGAVSAAEASARSFIDTVVAGLRSAGLRAEPLIQAGPVADVISEVAEHQKVQLIVLGANLREGLSSRLVGSVAERVMRRAPCPVLLVRQPPPTHHHRELWSFNEASQRAGALSRRPLGVRSVEVARIVGSVGRWSELGKNFRPVSTRKRAAEEERFERIRKVHSRGQALPPVELYKLGFGYYVLDGHHRIGVAHKAGQDLIDADVTEFVLTADPSAVGVFREQRQFEQLTGLTDIEAARPGTYAQLTDAISEHARRHGSSDLERIAAHWQSREYRPLWERTRQTGVRRLFPGDRGADIVARFDRWRGAYPDAGFEEFLAAYTA